MGEFKKGQVANPKGRTKGSKNGSTEAIKKMVAELVRSGLDKSIEKLKAIESPEKYLEVIAKFCQYVIPKNVDVKSDGEKIEIKITKEEKEL